MLRVVLPLMLVVTLLAQAARPKQRVTIVVIGAAASCLASTLLGGQRTHQILATVPWDVLVILVALGAISNLLAEARLFERIAVLVARASRGDPRRLYVVSALAMFVVSGVVNNLTALLLVLPVVLVIFRLLAPSQRYVSWSLGLLLVACNLGGAATPIGDFPAILLLGAGRISFGAYLPRASAGAAVALLALVAIVRWGAAPARGLPRDPLTLRLTLRVVEAMHRGVRLDRRLAAPAFTLLGAMLLAWSALPASLGVSPELVAWLGAAVALGLVGRRGERIARSAIDAEAVLFLLSLFVMVGAVRSTGVFELAGRALIALPVDGRVKLVLFLAIAGVLTGLFSAGPSMAALLEVADVLAKELEPRAVYVGLALAVCAGSSLFLTAATSGPLAQALVERADIRDERGNQLAFGFREFIPIGLVSFATILGVGMLQAVIGAR